MSNALPISGKSLPIGRKTLLSISRYYLSKMENREAIEAMENRAIINMCFHAVGRSGEVGLASWNGSYYEHDIEVPILDWNEMKTGHQNLMTLVCDSEHWEIDIIHSFAAYFVFGGGSNGYNNIMDRSHNWMFPSLACLGDGRAAAKVSKILQDLVNVVDGMKTGVAGTSLRLGATRQMVNTPGLDLIHAILRGGWDFQYMCNIFEYILQDITNLNIAGAALAGWKSIRHLVFPPRLVFRSNLDENYTLKINGLINELFRTTAYSLPIAMEPFYDVMMASLLQHLQGMIDRCTVHHPLLKRITSTANLRGISLALLKEWGEAVETDWRQRNILPNSGDNSSAIRNLSVDLNKLGQELKLIRDSQSTLYKDMQDRISEQNELIKNLICIVQEHQACSPSPQSSFKKQRIHSPAKINRPIESNELQEKDDRLPEQSAFNVLFQAKEVYTLEKLGGKACWKAV